jgi:hypothetical protein
MSIRTFIRILSLALGLMLVSSLRWRTIGPLSALAGVALLGLTLGYLWLLAGEGDLTRWRLRYRLETGEKSHHLEEIMRFLAEKTGHLVLEASAEGLFLELPPAFDRYLEAQLPKALPDLRLVRDGWSHADQSRCPSFFSMGPLSSDILRWATEGEGRKIRLHIHSGPCVTAIAQTDRDCPPGRWMRIRIPRRLGQRLPVWEDLSAGIRLSSLFPPTNDSAVYSSRSRITQLAPPDDYAPGPACRILGLSIDEVPLTVGYDIPLFTIGAPSSFLVQQALDDLATGRSVVVVSPHRRLLQRLGQQAGEATVRWLDPQNSRTSAHLAVVSREEWKALDIETIISAAQTFLADLGINVDLPAVSDFTERLLQALIDFARSGGRDLTFTDLYAISQSTQALRAFLHDAPGEAARELLSQLDKDGGYVQAVTILSAIRDALQPLRSRPLHTLCQSPFLIARRILGKNSLLLVPLDNDDFPENDRLLSTMLDLILNRELATESDLKLSLHLHDPHLYRDDCGQRWIDVARGNPHLSLLLDIQEPDKFIPGDGSQVIFRCSEGLAPTLIQDWSLPASIADLTELPTDTGLSRLQGKIVTLKVSNR